MRRVLAVVLLAVVVAACSGEEDELRRAYVLHRPTTGDAEEPAALILAFHATGSAAARFEDISRLHAHAPEAAVAYVEGVDGRWSEDDVDAAATAVDELADRGIVDPERVHLVGFSGGAALALRIAAEDGESYRAVAAVAGQLTADVQPSSPIPLVLFYGVDDPLRSIDGSGTGASRSIGALATAERFAGGGETDSFGLRDGDPDDGTGVHRWRWRGGKAAVDLYYVTGGGHTWPGTPVRTSVQRYGLTSRDVDASALIVEFFRIHGSLDSD